MFAFNAHVRSVLQYASVIWSGVAVSHLTRLERLHGLLRYHICSVSEPLGSWLMESCVFHTLRLVKQTTAIWMHLGSSTCISYAFLTIRYIPRRGSRGGGALGRAPTPGTEGLAPKARVPSSQGQKEGTLVSLEWSFNTIQA